MGYFRFVRINWLFLLAGFLLSFTSSYGQTYFISLFAGEIKGEFGLSDGQWGGIYTIGTTLSAVTMIWAGVLTDRYRIRALALIVMIGLSCACLAMAAVPNWILLVFVIFALRFTGQGMLSQLAAVAMVRWFEAARGKALSISSMGFAVGQAFLPIIFEKNCCRKQFRLNLFCLYEPPQALRRLTDNLSVKMQREHNFQAN